MAVSKAEDMVMNVIAYPIGVLIALGFIGAGAYVVGFGLTYVWSFTVSFLTGIGG
jgi:hypothetical protein